MPQCIPGGEIVLLAASTSIAISNELNAEDTGILASFFSALGDNLAIIAAKKQICEEAK